jgi:hypothetical protein
MTLELDTDRLNHRIASALGLGTLVPRYDTIPEAVFGSRGLVEQMKERGFYVALMWQIPDREPEPWCASFERLGVDDEWVAYGSTPMEAIARAALAALKVQILTARWTIHKNEERVGDA